MELVSEKAGGADAASLAFRSIVWPHLSAAYNLARYIVRDASAAEDVTQEALLLAWRHYDRVRGEAVRPWLLAIVRNACHDHHRRKHRAWGERAAYPLDAAEDVPDDAAADPEAAAISAEEITALRGAIWALPESRRETLVLRELEGLSYKEISEITSAPIGTVMSRLARARADLEGMLRPPSLKPAGANERRQERTAAPERGAAKPRWDVASGRCPAAPGSR